MKDWTIPCSSEQIWNNLPLKAPSHWKQNTHIYKQKHNVPFTTGTWGRAESNHDTLMCVSYLFKCALKNRPSREPFERSISLLNTFWLVVGSFTAESLIAICIKFRFFQLSFTELQFYSYRSSALSLLSLYHSCLIESMNGRLSLVTLYSFWCEHTVKA